jgi:hypothetical protein
VDGALEELGRAVADWRLAFGRSLAVDFEPALRPNEDGSLRLYWGFPQRVATALGTRTFTEYISGRPSDLWMRERRIPAQTRKEVGAFLKRILPLERRYRDLVSQVGRHRRRIGELLSRVARLDGPARPATGPVRPPEAPRGGEEETLKEACDVGSSRPAAAQ